VEWQVAFGHQLRSIGIGAGLLATDASLLGVGTCVLGTGAGVLGTGAGVLGIGTGVLARGAGSSSSETDSTTISFVVRLSRKQAAPLTDMRSRAKKATATRRIITNATQDFDMIAISQPTVALELCEVYDQYLIYDMPYYSRSRKYARWRGH
jgi:hypothetical protein